MRQLYFACLILLVCACPSVAQSGNSDRCEVALVDPKAAKTTVLGTFTTVIAEEELTTRAFRLPGHKLYVVASVFYTDESMASKRGADSVTLEIALSTGRKRDVLRSLSWATAEMPLNGFDVGRVSMMITLKGRAKVVLMQCREDVRR